MGRRSALLKVYSHVLRELIQRMDDLHGYPGGLNVLKLPPHDYTCWWRWRTGKRLFSEHIARVLVEHFIKTPDLFGDLDEDVMGAVMVLSQTLNPELSTWVTEHINNRIRDSQRMRALVGLVAGYDKALATSLSELADKQEAYIQAYRDKDSLVVSTLYSDAAEAVYLDDLMKSGIPEEVARMDEAELPDTLVIRPLEIRRKKAYRR